MMISRIRTHASSGARSSAHQAVHHGARDDGFTLIELMVAIFITAIVFAMGYGAVNQALNNRDALEDRQKRLLEIQTTMRTMAQDFGQLSSRPVRDPTNDTLQPVLRTQNGTNPYLVFTRGGWANPAGVQRPALQRVGYLLEDNKLVREYWPVLDALLSTQPIKKDLLTGVRTVTFKYMDVSRQYKDTWPPTQTAAVAPGQPNSAARMRPIAVEVTIELDDFGKIRRLFEVPT